MPQLPLRQLSEGASTELCCSAKQGPIKFYYRQHNFFSLLFTLLLEFTLKMICVIIMYDITQTLKWGHLKVHYFLSKVIENLTNYILCLG